MSVRTIFNTAIAANMELLNTLSRFEDESANGKAIRQETLEAITLMLSPIVPHICHQLWLELGHLIQEGIVNYDLAASGRIRIGARFNRIRTCKSTANYAAR